MRACLAETCVEGRLAGGVLKISGVVRNIPGIGGFEGQGFGLGLAPSLGPGRGPAFGVDGSGGRTGSFDPSVGAGGEEREPPMKRGRYVAGAYDVAVEGRPGVYLPKNPENDPRLPSTVSPTHRLPPHQVPPHQVPPHGLPTQVQQPHMMPQGPVLGYSSSGAAVGVPEMASIGGGLVGGSGGGFAGGECRNEENGRRPSLAEKDIEISRALDTLRALIASRYPNALPALSNLRAIICQLSRAVASPMQPGAVQAVQTLQESGSQHQPGPLKLLKDHRRLLDEGILTARKDSQSGNESYLLRIAPLLLRQHPAFFSRRPSPPSGEMGSGDMRRGGDQKSDGRKARRGTSDGGEGANVTNATNVQSMGSAQPAKEDSNASTTDRGGVDPGGPMSAAERVREIFREKFEATAMTRLTTEAAAASRWRGTLTRNEKKKMEVVLTQICGPDLRTVLPAESGNLNVSHRSQVEEIAKKGMRVICTLQPATEDGPAAAAFQECLQYFQQKNRAGVVRLESADFHFLYILPPTGNVMAETIKAIHKDTPKTSFMFAVFADAATDHQPPTPAPAPPDKASAPPR